MDDNEGHWKRPTHLHTLYHSHMLSEDVSTTELSYIPFTMLWKSCKLSNSQSNPTIPCPARQRMIFFSFTVRLKGWAHHHFSPPTTTVCHDHVTMTTTTTTSRNHRITTMTTNDDDGHHPHQHQHQQPSNTTQVPGCQCQREWQLSLPMLARMTMTKTIKRGPNNLFGPQIIIFYRCLQITKIITFLLAPLLPRLKCKKEKDCFSSTIPLHPPSLKMWDGGGYLSPLPLSLEMWDGGDICLPPSLLYSLTHSKRKTEGDVCLPPPLLPPSLTQNVRQRGLSI